MTGKFAQNGLAYRSSDEKNTAAIWKKGMGYRSSDEKNQKKRLAFFGFFRGGGQTAGRTRRHYRYIDETSHTVPLANCSKGIEKIRWIFRLFAPLRFCRY